MVFSLKKENKSSEFDYIDDRGCSYSSPEEWFWTTILGGCGCGSSDDFAEKAVKVLCLFATPHMERKWDIYDDEVAEIIAHWMDSKGIIEHGSSIAGSWLTEEGKNIYTIIKGLTGDKYVKA